MAALAIGAAVWFLAHNTLLNMQARGIKSGFDFLTQAAGFDIGESLCPFDSAQPYGQAFLVVVTNTLSVAKGERIVICGPSGSGKSTLIRCINRLEERQQGRLIVDGIELADDVKAIDQVRKEVGMVFQQFNLFPHLTVLENLTLSPMWVGKMIVEQNNPHDFFNNPQNERSKDFLSKILGH